CKSQGRKIHVIKKFRESLARNIMNVQAFSKVTNKKLSHVTQVDSRNITPAQKFDIVITSPPYIDAQKYMRSSKLELYWLGFEQKEISDLDRKSIGTEKICVPKNYQSNSKIYEISQLVDEIKAINSERAFVLEKYL